MANGQDQLFPQYVDTELQEHLVASYKPYDLLSYSTTRDTMYRHVFSNKEGNVTCYYTGHSIFLPDDVDPSSYLYNDADYNGITTEHIYPQSKGAGSGDARRDMHNLVPSIWRVNEARSNYSFGEVPDTETDNWYAYTEDLSDMPSENIDLYSERLKARSGNPGRFEPRESVQGDVARAIFYFYTMYKEEADDADPNFFHDMKEVLYMWHLQDPVDSLEQVRNLLKAKYQQGKPNPFILDCSLVRRAYFSDRDIDSNCANAANTTTVVHESDASPDIIVYPNPFTDRIYLKTLGVRQKVSYSINTIDGRKLLQGEVNSDKQIDLAHMQSGFYLLMLTDHKGNTVVHKICKQ